MKIFFIIVILNSRLFSSCWTSSLDDGKDRSLKLISKILRSVDFQNCALFFYSTNENKIWPISTESPITNSLYTGKLKTPVYVTVDSTVNYSEDVTSLFSSPLADSMLNTMKLQSKVSRVKKFSDNCLFHVVDLEDVENLKLYPSFLKRITSLHPSPLIHRTTDYFLFILSQKSFEVLASTSTSTTTTKKSTIIETTAIQSTITTKSTKDSTLHPKYRDFLSMRIYNKIFLIIPQPVSPFESTTTTSSTKTKTSMKDQIQIKYACIYCSNSGPADDSGLNLNIPFVNLLTVSHKDEIFQTENNKVLTKSLLYPYYTRNLNGYKIRCSVPSAVIARVLLRFNNDTGEYETVRGLQLVLLNILKAQMNFTMKVFPSAGGGGTGLRANNSTWFGVVGDVYHERADIGTGVGISVSRFEVIDFIGYYEYISLVFVMGKQDQIFTWLAVFWPFNRIVWGFVVLCIIVTFIFCTVLRYFGSKNLTKEQDNTSEIVETTITITATTTATTTSNNIPTKQSKKKKVLKIKSTRINPKARIYLQKQLSQDIRFLSAGHLIIHIVETMLGQTAPLPKTSSVRFFTAFWLLFLIVITTAYTSKLFGFLAFPMLEKVPTTFEELADAENYDIGLRYIGGAGYNSFKTSNTPAIQKIFKRMELVKDPLKCFGNAIASKYACIAYELQFQYSKQRNFSDIHGRTTLSISQGRIFPVNVGLGVQKGTVFATQVDKIITSAFETGLVDTWSKTDMQDIHLQKGIWEKANNIAPFVVGNQDQRPQPLTIPHFTGAYFLFFCGLGSAFVFFAFEEFYYSYRRCMNR